MHTPAVFVRETACAFSARPSMKIGPVAAVLRTEYKGLSPIFIAVANKRDKPTQRTGIEVRPSRELPIGGSKVADREEPGKRQDIERERLTEQTGLVSLTHSE